MADLPYTESDMPVTIVDDSGDGNIVQISSVGGGSLKIDGSAVTQPTSAPGIVSVGNSTTTPLGSNGIFTGTFENVKDYAYIALIIFADQASASSGFSMQWSPDGVNVDRTENSNLTASSGRAFAIQVRAQYFRVVYTNGTIAQGTFRLNTNYHVTGTGLITRPLTTVVSTDNFSLLTISATAGLSGTSILPITTTVVSTSQALDVNEVASPTQSAAAAGQIYVTSFEFNLPTNGTESPAVYIKNPSGSGKTLILKLFAASCEDGTNGAAVVRIYGDPTTSANGTAQTISSTSIGGGASASAMTAFSGPTVSANGTILFAVNTGSGNVTTPATMPIDFDGIIRISANHTLLVTGEPTTNNMTYSFVIMWQEV